MIRPFDAINAAALAQIESLLREWFPHGRRDGHEWRVGSIHGEPGESFGVNMRTGKWGEFNGHNPTGGDVISLFAAKFCNGRQGDAARELGNRLGIDSQRGAATPIVYDYRDEKGALLFQVVRHPPKSFRQRRPDGRGGWIWNTRSVRRVLYRLPELLAADPSQPVFIVEGEKDVDNLRAIGLTATCNPNGAGKWQPEYSKCLRGRTAIILPDNDEAGRSHAAQVRQMLTGFARTVRVVELPGLPHKSDVSDWVANSGTADALLKLASGAAVRATNSTAPPVPDNGADAEQVSAPTQAGDRGDTNAAAQSQPNGAQAPGKTAPQPPDPTPPTPPEIDVSILRLNRRPPPPFPLAILGDRWWTWTERAAQAACAPVDYVAAPLLATGSALIGNARWAQAWGIWAEPPHLWCAPIGDSGDGKTPGAKTLFAKIVPELDRRMIGDFPQRHAEWKAAVESTAVREAAWKENAKNAAKGGKALPPRPSDELAEEPQEPRIMMVDATIEKVGALLATAAPKGLLMYRDELAGFLLGMNQYNDAARQYWLQAWDGNAYPIDRQKNAKPLRVRHNVVAWFGGIQPERLAQVMGEADDGLLARFVWFWPNRVPFARSHVVPDVDFALRALDRLRRLEMRRADDGTLAPIMVPAVEAAWQRLEAFGGEMQRHLDLAAGLMRSAIGKARGIALRAALVLEMLWWCGRDDEAEPPPAMISDAAMEAATAWVRDYVLPMAERTYGDAAASQEDRNVTTLARWVARERPSEVHVRTMQRDVRLPGLTKAEPIHTACAALVEAGWLMPEPGQTGFQKRPRAAYRVNPALWDALA